MKVNMTPNPLDVVTIHASQGDTEARQWEFELHNNGELIDTSDVKEQMFFKAYKGGIEQLLPENTSTPTTSPFKGDIKYPQGLLTDQEFLYRQSPTEEDGLAKITDIKGNTLVWNQLINTVTSKTADGITTSFDSSTGLFSIRNDSRTTNFSSGSNSNTLVANATCIAGHKYLINADKTIQGVTIHTGSQQEYVPIMLSYSGTAGFYIRITYAYDFVSAHPVGDVTSFHIYIVDLTQMFGTGNEPTIEEFTSLFPLSYYAYNQGSLLSFNGNGIKTVGKNLLNPSFTTINAYINGSGVITASSNDKSVIIPLLPNLSYVFTWNRGEIISSVTDDSQVGLYNEYPSIGMIGAYGGNTNVNGGNIRFNSGSNRYAVIKISNITRTDFDSTIIGSQLEFGTTPSSYEPYTSSTLSLPISAYFPTGMKSAGSVYDELTESKAYTRVGSIDLGSMSWTAITQNNIIRMRSYDIKTLIKYPSANNQLANMVCAKYATLTANNTYDGQVGISCQNNGDIYVYDSAYSTAKAFKSAMNGVYLCYELATPTETSFTTASLVTENAELPLSNVDGVLIGKCTEELSAEPGFHDAKIKLSDSDGTCYSNKLQLHVERSPQ